MSEQTFSPGAVAPEVDGVGEADEASAGRSRKTIFVAAGVGLLVAVAAYFLFFSGGSDNSSADLGGAVAKPSASAGVSKLPSASASAAVTTLPVVQVGKAGRDPFKALVVAPVATTAATAPSPTATPTASTGTSGVPTTGVPNLLKVTRVDPIAGVVDSSVNGKPYAAMLGMTFAKYFKLIAIGPTATCAVFQYGDATVPLCKGQSLTLTG